MGNTESNVTSGVKKQADTSSILMYKLVDLNGGGLLVELMKQAAQTKQFAELDHAIKTKVEPFLYNKGEGALLPIWKLVVMRNKERPRHKLLPILKSMDDPNEFNVEADVTTPPEVPEKLGPNDYRKVCWNLNERGAVGETILHLCLLNATSIHADLAKRLLKFYPRLIDDIYISDEYYGENVLHIAIVNEDPSMVKFLLDNGANHDDRCLGSFFGCEDQKASKNDSLEHEWFNLQLETSYEGYVYWGEYPLSISACLGLEECYRLLLARGANPDNQDTNGNTVLHMLIIHEKMQSFDMAYEAGADVEIQNALNLTPLTLAAKLARVEMFFHILNIEREIYWQIGNITCAAYPLSRIDTIDNATGYINNNSALNLVVFGDKDEHLELMDGVIIDLLNAKWNTFVKFRFYRQFFQFALYFVISLICFTLRPGPKPIEQPNPSVSSYATNVFSLYSLSTVSETESFVFVNYSRRVKRNVNVAIINEDKDIGTDGDNNNNNNTNTGNNNNNNSIIISHDRNNSISNISKSTSISNSSLKPPERKSSSAATDDNSDKKKNATSFFTRISHKTVPKAPLTISNPSAVAITTTTTTTTTSPLDTRIPTSAATRSLTSSSVGNRKSAVTSRPSASSSEFKAVITSSSYAAAKNVATNNKLAPIRATSSLYGVASSAEPADKDGTKDEVLVENIQKATADDKTNNGDYQFNPDTTTPTYANELQVSNEFGRQKKWWKNIIGKCRLLTIDNYKDVVRIAAEITLEVGALLYLLAAVREAGFLGLNTFIENLMTAPSRVMFLFSCLLMMILPFLRFSCFDQVEDIIAVIIMLTTSPYFLFYCRGFKTVGPFVVMIYRMVMGDLLRFVMIYLVFVMGFSQAYYIIFLSFDNPATPDGVDDSVSNPMPHPMESFMAMFLMSLTTFSDYYGAYDKTNHGNIAKFCFVLYMVIVAILLVNMLIAMMGNTYQKIAETRNEWQRQWARIVLVVERSVTPSERLKKLMIYSQPMSDGRRALVLRLNQSDEDKEEMKDILEMKRSHQKNTEKRKMRNRKGLSLNNVKSAAGVR